MLNNLPMSLLPPLPNLLIFAGLPGTVFCFLFTYSWLHYYTLELQLRINQNKQEAKMTPGCIHSV